MIIHQKKTKSKSSVKRDLLKKRREFQSRIGTRANFGVEWEPDSGSVRRGQGDGPGGGGEGEQSAVLGRSGGQSFAGGWSGRRRR